jgi:hypothetical protein
MSNPQILILYDNSERAAFGRPYQREFVAAGFNVIVAVWRDVALTAKGAMLSRGLRISTAGAEPLFNEPIEPRFLLHRKLVGEESARMISEIIESCPGCLSSYHPGWRWIGEKWILESCFREADFAVSRPRTYLVDKLGMPETLRRTGHARPLIFKPADASLCRGIELSSPDNFDSVAEKVARSMWSRYVVQDLVEETLLYQGRRFDLRIYVLITSFRPLRLMVPREGLVRLAAREFDPKKPDEALGVLTGSSYRTREGFSVNNITITKLLSYLSSLGLDVTSFWDNVDSLLQSVFTSLADVGPLAEATDLARCFYLGGVDVLIVPRGNSYSLLFLETNYVPNLVGSGPSVDLPIIKLGHREWISHLRRL